MFATPERFRLIGVVHLGPLPGAPRFTSSMARVLEAARHDAAALAAGGADGIVVENFGDVPFGPGALAPETVAAMALAVEVVADEAGALPVGVNCLRNDARAALGLCAATRACFLRVNVHTGSMHTDQGPLVGAAAATLRERARLGLDAPILADVHVKHAVPPPGERLEDAAEDAVRRGLADAVVVTGRATGAPALAEDLARVRERLPSTPLYVGSGVTPERARELVGVANGAIVGTWLKRDGAVENAVDPGRVEALRAAFDA